MEPTVETTPVSKSSHQMMYFWLVGLIAVLGIGWFRTDREAERNKTEVMILSRQNGILEDQLRDYEHNFAELRHSKQTARTYDDGYRDALLRSVAGNYVDGYEAAKKVYGNGSYRDGYHNAIEQFSYFGPNSPIPQPILTSIRTQVEKDTKKDKK